MQMKKAVIGVVEDATRAEVIVRALFEQGLSKNDVSVILAGSVEGSAHARKSEAASRVAVGAGTGGVLAATFGLLAGAGSIGVPGVGQLIGAGALFAALNGSGSTLATFGTVAGFLAGIGVPEVQAKLYESTMRQGHLLVSAQVETNEALRR
jgi:hypothetical protein